jgi:hypothetical protein
MVVVVVVVVHNLVAMWMLSMLSTLPHRPDLELGAVDDGYMHEECVEGA